MIVGVFCLENIFHWVISRLL